MHDREKSDPAIVAEKPTNKAGQPAAESAEPRVGAEGNASWQSTHRTQGRERVSQALERVRQVARQRKKEKFTALLHHVGVDLLGMAFFALKRDAAPGVDGLTWRTYEADLDRNLTDLHERVHRGAYRALPSRRTYIPKADGKQRPLAVATVPSHPLRGQRFVVLKVRRVAGADTLSLRPHDLGSFAMAREWTDWAPAGASAVSAGKSLMIDAFGLLSLTELVTSLTRNGGLDR